MPGLPQGPPLVQEDILPDNQAAAFPPSSAPPSVRLLVPLVGGWAAPSRVLPRPDALLPVYEWLPPPVLSLLPHWTVKAGEGAAPSAPRPLPPVPVRTAWALSCPDPLPLQSPGTGPSRASATAGLSRPHPRSPLETGLPSPRALPALPSPARAPASCVPVSGSALCGHILWSLHRPGL